MAWTEAAVALAAPNLSIVRLSSPSLSSLFPASSFPSLFSSTSTFCLPFASSSCSFRRISPSWIKPPSFLSSFRQQQQLLLLCKAAEYQFPDPIPEFAETETEKFRTHLLKKLAKKNLYGDSLEEVVGICTEIFSTFLHTEYGGPGTLLVIPFIDMADTLNERGLPGAPQAARAAVVWAQKHVDKDWNELTGGDNDAESD